MPSTNPATGHLLMKVGETLTIFPEPRTVDVDSDAAKVVVNKISRGKKGMDGPTLRMDVTVTTGNNPETNKNAREFLCGTPNSVDPESGEEVFGGGGFMVSGNPPFKLGTNHTYRCTFDAESLHDHGWLVLGPYELQVDYPYDLR